MAKPLIPVNFTNVRANPPHAALGNAAPTDFNAEFEERFFDPNQPIEPLDLVTIDEAEAMAARQAEEQGVVAKFFGAVKKFITNIGLPGAAAAEAPTEKKKVKKKKSPESKFKEFFEKNINKISIVGNTNHNDDYINMLRNACLELIKEEGVDLIKYVFEHLDEIKIVITPGKIMPSGEFSIPKNSIIFFLADSHKSIPAELLRHEMTHALQFWDRSYCNDEYLEKRWEALKKFGQKSYDCIFSAAGSENLPQPCEDLVLTVEKYFGQRPSRFYSSKEGAFPVEGNFERFDYSIILKNSQIKTEEDTKNLVKRTLVVSYRRAEDGSIIRELSGTISPDKTFHKATPKQKELYKAHSIIFLEASSLDDLYPKKQDGSFLDRIKRSAESEASLHSAAPEGFLQEVAPDDAREENCQLNPQDADEFERSAGYSKKITIGAKKRLEAMDLEPMNGEIFPQKIPNPPYKTPDTKVKKPSPEKLTPDTTQQRQEL